MIENEQHEITTDSAAQELPAYSLFESKMTQSGDILLEKLQAAVHQETSQIITHDLVKIAIEHDPVDLAHAVAHIPFRARYIIYENLSDMDAKIQFITQTSARTRIAIFRYASDLEIKNLIESMPSDEAVFILEDLSERRFKKVLELIEPSKAQKIKELQKHSLYTAGRMMSNEFFAFNMNTTIGEVIEAIRGKHGIELTDAVFVIDEEKQLVGSVPIRNIVVNAPSLLVKQVMQPVTHTVHTDTLREEVVELADRYQMGIIAVVDSKNELLGVITYDEVFNVMQDFAEETIASIGGTSENITEEDPLIKRFLGRIPWLTFTLCAMLTSSTILMLFDGEPWFAMIAVFVPLINGMSGNVGIQSSTFFVRGIATREISPGTTSDVLIREITTGLIIGLFFGILSGILIFLLNALGIHQTESPLMIATVVCLGLFSACFMATLLGTFSPLFFARLRIDPAVASGPIVAALNDVIASSIYIFVARMVIALF